MKTTLCFLFFVVGCYSQAITFSMSDVYVKQGEDAVIPCSYTTTLTGVPTIKWYRVRNGSPQLLYTYKADDSSVTGKAARILDDIYVNDQGSLEIYDVTISDDSNFKNLQCNVEFGQDSNGQGETTFNVVVLAEKEPVTLLEGQSREFQSGGEIGTTIGTCESDYAYPQPVITFYRDNDDLTPAETDDDEDFAGFLDTNTFDYKPDGRIAVKNTLVRTLSKEDDGATFYCVVTSGAGGANTTRIQRVMFPSFRVTYPTDMVSFKDLPKQVVAGEELQLMCEANGYPEPTIRLDGQAMDSMTFTVRKNDNNRNITCRASNQQDTAAVETSYTLDVIYADQPQIEGDDRELTYGEGLSLTCIGKSRPKPMSVYWEKDGIIVSDSGDFTIPEVSFTDAGVYTCVVQNKFEELTRRKNTKEIVVNGLVLKGSGETVELDGKIDETATLVCVARGHPAPSFAWSRKATGSESAEEEVEGDKLEVFEESGEYHSTLTVGPFEPSMSKMQYICRASSGESAVQMKIYELPELIEASGSTAAIIIGVLVGIALIAIILVILYRKGMICNKKGEDGEEDAKDISMKMNKDPEVGQQTRNEYAETDQNEASTEHKSAAESDALINGTEQ